MSLITRLFGPRPDEHVAVRPLWSRVVAIAREPQWYTKGGIADTATGRFDALTMVLALLLMRMERDPVLSAHIARLTELFVEDIDGQLREFGVGDPVMGKRMGRLMSVLGGRIGAYRDALAQGSDAALVATVERNVSFGATPDPAAVAAEISRLAVGLASLDSASLLEGRIPR